MPKQSQSLGINRGFPLQQIAICRDGSLIAVVLERPIGDSYIEHARENGYTIDVGEFYITRQDGGVFQ